MKRILAILMSTWASSSVGAQMPGDAAIRAILANRVDTQKQSTAIVVGLIDAGGSRIVAYGRMAQGGDQPVTGDTIFEIGSVTKVFTSLLLADMVEKGEVALGDPASKYLPAGAKMPARAGRAITLEHLATHTSALPRLPSNLAPKDPQNPYADYGSTELYAFLSDHELSRDIASRYEYSNLGAGLLGHLLARRAGTDYETLLRARIFEPLGMKNTGITVPTAKRALLAQGHDASLAPVPNWDFDVLAGAGAVRSTASDLLTFLSAAIGVKETPLAKALKSMVATRRKTDTASMDIALGWHISNINGREIVWHNGGTGGYRSFIGYDAERRTGVVVLSNTFTAAGVDDIALHLLDPRSALASAPKQRNEIRLDAKLLDRYVGRYRVAPEFILTVTREGDQLYVQATSQPRLPVFAEGERKFFYKAVDAQLTFETGSDGGATRVILHQNGRDIPAERVEGEILQPKVAKVSAEILSRYVGRYEIAPTFVLSVTREDDRLFVQATGQPRLEVFARTEREFFYKAVDAQISFVADRDGAVRSLVLHQNGQHVPARKLE